MRTHGALIARLKAYPPIEPFRDLSNPHGLRSNLRAPGSRSTGNDHAGGLKPRIVQRTRTMTRSGKGRRKRPGLAQAPIYIEVSQTTVLGDIHAANPGRSRPIRFSLLSSS